MTISLKFYLYFQITPTLFRNLFKNIKDVPNTLRNLVLGGEPFPNQNEVMKKMLDSNMVKIYNIYGVTELSSWATCQFVTNYDLK